VPDLAIRVEAPRRTAVTVPDTAFFADVPAAPPSASLPMPSAGGGAGADGTGAGTGAGGGTGAGEDSGSGVPPPRPAFYRPDWIERPDRYLIGYYPRRAVEGQVTGAVVLVCTVDIANTARNCRVASETPTGYGFGRAALLASRRFRIRAPREEGRPLHDVPVRIPINFFGPPPPRSGSRI
jgi:protein TonB